MRAARLAVAVALALAAAGCGSSTPSSAPTAPVIAASPSSAPRSGVPSPAGSVGASGPDGSPAAPVALDESLLAILPADLQGVAVTQEPDSFAPAAADPDFARNVGSAAFAIVVDGGDLASGVVAHLRPGHYSDELFRDWRDSYNEGACSQAGGVTGNAQAELGGRTVYVGTCKGGITTYHAYLGQRDVIVSLFSLGDRRFGEQLMSGLRP